MKIYQKCIAGIFYDITQPPNVRSRCRMESSSTSNVGIALVFGNGACNDGTFVGLLISQAYLQKYKLPFIRNFIFIFILKINRCELFNFKSIKEVKH